MVPLLLAAGFSAPLGWQEPPPPVEAEKAIEQRVAAALRTLKSRKLNWYDKEYALYDLVDSGPPGQEALVQHLSKELKKLEANHWKDRTTLEKDFKKASARLARNRLNRKGAYRLEAARETLLDASRSKNLTKEMVEGVCDPAVDEIVGILEITVPQVLDTGEDLASHLASIEETLEVHRWLYDYWMDAQEVLLKAEGKWGARAKKRALPANPTRHHVELNAILETLAFAAEIMPERDRATLKSNALLFEKLEPGEGEGIRDLNILLIRAGIGSLRVDLKLCEAGRGHSKDMVDHGFFAHESPVDGKRTPSDRASLAGTSGGAENIAAGMDSGPGAIRAWWYSPGHHRNMMGSHGRTGLGRFESHWTQMFGK
jgi:hypothetical protein